MSKFNAYYKIPNFQKDFLESLATYMSISYHLSHNNKKKEHEIKIKWIM